MDDHDKTREQLAAELETLRQYAADLEARLEECRAQKEIEKSYSGIFHNNHTMMLLIDPVTADIVDANSAACTFYGYPYETLTGLKITNINIASEEEVRQEMKRAETEQRRHFHFRHRLASGEVREVDVYSGPIRRGDRSLLYSVIHDVTERRRTEKALSESESRYRALFEDSPISLWEEDLSGCKTYIDDLRAQGVADLRAYFEQHPEALVACAQRAMITRINRASLEMFCAASEAELVGSLDRLLGPESYNPFREALLTLAAGGAHFRAETLAYPLRGDPIQVIMWMSVAPGCETTWEKVFVSVLDITERLQAEEALRQSEARYRLLADNISDVIWTLDLQGRFTYVSPSVERLRGYTPEEVMAQPISASLTPASLKVAEQGLREVYEKEMAGIHDPQQYRFELEQPCKDGSTVWTEVIASVMWDAEKRFAGIMGVTRDITERRQAEAALRESEEHFRLLANVAFEGIYIHENGLLLEISQPCARLFGYTVDELIGRQVVDLFAPESRPLVTQYIATDYEQPYEAVGLRADGSTFPAEVLGKGTFYRGRRVRVVAIRNLTEEKKAQEALEAERKLLRTMIDTLPDSVYVKDAEGRFIMVNAKLIRDVGASCQADMLGKTDFDYFPAHLVAEWRASEEEIIRTGQPIINREEPAMRPNGQVSYFLTSKVPLRDADGTITRIVGITRDVTELRAAEERAVALKIEQERVKLLQRFLNGASHDLRTPLASLKASLAVLTMLRQAPDPEKQQRHLNILEMQTRHLQRLLDDLMSIARLEETILLQPAPLDLNALGTTIIREHRPLAQRRRHRIEFVPDPTLPPVWADSSKLHRALTAFVTNALHYTPDGGVITLRTYRQGEEAVVEVQDMGIGMSEADLPHIFDQFYRADPARSAATGGLGLSLSIARELIQAHHGHIEVESAVGVGSTFRIFLPLAAPVG